jgi:hypothetical protein
MEAAVILFDDSLFFDVVILCMTVAIVCLVIDLIKRPK